MYALKITTEGSVTIVSIDAANRLEALQAQVGGYIEEIPLTDQLSFLGDEEAKLKNAEVNTVASRIRELLFGRYIGDYLCGDVLLVGRGHDNFVSPDLGEIVSELL